MPSSLAITQVFHGLQQTVRATSGATVFQVIHPAHQQIDAHCHDWPFLALYRLGGYCERFGSSEHVIDGPSVVFHPAGREHGDSIGAYGLESITLEFDPAWLGPVMARLGERSWVRTGPAAAAAAHHLRALWCDAGISATQLRAMTMRSLDAFMSAPPPPPAPSWMGPLREALVAEPLASTASIAKSLELHPAWVARRYRQATGEGIGHTVQRRQVERATQALRAGVCGLAEIATASGFCDQSHMNRAFRSLTGRTPLEVRREAGRLSAFMEHCERGPGEPPH